MNLDDKLREILEGLADEGGYWHSGQPSEAVAQIKQAFADAKTNEFLAMPGYERMGREFYERFKAELVNKVVDTDPVKASKFYMNAAKRAAGLSQPDVSDPNTSTEVDKKATR